MDVSLLSVASEGLCSVWHQNVLVSRCSCCWPWHAWPCNPSSCINSQHVLFVILALLKTDLRSKCACQSQDTRNIVTLPPAGLLCLKILSHLGYSHSKARSTEFNTQMMTSPPFTNALLISPGFAPKTAMQKDSTTLAIP